MTILDTVVLAIVQGAAELLPVSSSAHVIFAGSLLGIDRKAPAFHFMMAMLHTGTMGAVIIFFFSRWKALLTDSKERRNEFLVNVGIASAATAVVGLVLKHVIEKDFLGGRPIEDLFDNLPLIAAALGIVGLLILYSAWREKQMTNKAGLSYSGSFITGFMQGICIPFRGFSRSGATISTGLILGFSKERAEEFSFALAVVLTPAVIVREAWRLHKQHAEGGFHFDFSIFTPGLIGMVLSFVSGWIALRFLASWMEKGRWSYFGYYCLAFAGVFAYLSMRGA